MPRIPRRVWIFALCFVAVASLPVVVGFLNAPAGGAFTGNAFEQTRVDFYSYMARIELGRRGDWLLHIQFTPEEHPGLFLTPFYLLLGHVARILNVSNLLVFLGARMVCTLAMLLAIWAFLGRFLKEARVRWWAFLLATVTAGAGWLLYLVIPAQTASLAPIEFWLIDAYTFLAALSFPHFALAVTLLLSYLLVLDRWLEQPGWRGAIGLAILSLPLGWTQPFHMLLTGLISAGLSLWALYRQRITWRQIWMLAPAAVAHLVVAGYHYAALFSDPIWRAFTAQNITASPPPWYFVLAYLWLLIPAVVGGIDQWRARNRHWLLPALWILLVAVLIYVPLPNQRRYVLAVQVPLAALAALGLERWRAWWLAHGRRLDRWRLLVTTGLLFSTLTHILLLVSALGTLNPATRPELFLSHDELASEVWLRAQPQDSVVFSTFPSGGKIAAFTGQRVYIGHWIETVDFAAREAQVAAFFDDGMTDAQRQALLQSTGVDYVWVDRTARALGDWPEGDVSFLRPGFEAETVTVYEVIP